MFKKIFFGVSALALAFAANAGVEYPFYVKSDFVLEDGLSDAWTTYGITNKPIQAYDKYFPTPETGPWYELIQPAGEPVCALSCASFQDLAKADQWLVSSVSTPQQNKVMYSFKSVSYAAQMDCNFYMYASNDGKEKEAFLNAGPKYTGTVGFNTQGPKTIMSSGVFEVEKGKDMYVAFVNANNRSGLVGFADIVVGPYLIDVLNADKLNGVILDKDAPYFSFKIQIRTPDICKGVTAKLTTKDSHISSTFTCTDLISYGQYTEITVSFPDKINLGNLASDEFTVELTPNYEGAPATVITGLLVGSMNLYNSVAVVEDLTGTWCNNCPRAIALMDYYRGEYPRKNGRPQFIGIAAHGSSGYDDPMECLDYLTGVKNTYLAISGASGVGFPTFVKNRESAVSPLASNYYIFPTYLDDILKRGSNVDVEITSVEVDPVDDKVVTVRYVLTAAMEGESNFNASVVVIENNVKGDNADYNQSNSMSFGSAFINGYFGAGAYEKYFAQYDQKGTIPYTRMVYNDVARGVYPSYAGTKLLSPLEFNKPLKYHVTFKMPAVDNRNNTEMVLLLTNRTTGEIVTADIRPYLYTSVGVEEVEYEGGDSIVISENGALKAFASAPGMMTVYSLDGKLLYTGAVEHGLNVVNLDYKGMVLVRLNTDGVQRSFKLIL